MLVFFYCFSDEFALFPHAIRAQEVKNWLQSLSDGYVLIKQNDPMMKIDGPFVIGVTS